MKLSHDILLFLQINDAAGVPANDLIFPLDLAELHETIGSMTYREEGEMPTLSPHKKHCYACANILDIRAELCPKCGVRQPVIPGTMALVPQQQALAATTRNKTSAALFAFFLGGLGIHKFYLGQTALGVVYLIFCWTLIPSIVALIEGIVLIGMSDAEFAQKYPG